MREVVELDLEGTPRAPACARRAIAGLPLTDDEGFALALLISEMVANSVRHGDLAAEDRVRLRVDLAERRIRAEVRDPGRGGTPGLRPTDERGGWGLRLVGRLATRWGWHGEDGTRVWFELDRRRSAAAGGSPVL